MSDITVRLRNTDCGDPVCGKIAMEAADEIARLRAALREIVDRTGSNLARAALEGK